MITVAIAARTTSYLESVKEECINDNKYLITAYTVGNSQGGTQAYILSDPIYEKTFNLKDPSDETKNRYNVKVQAYSYTIFDKKNSYNYFAIIFKDIEINVDGVLRDADGLLQMTAQFEFDQSILIDNTWILTHTTAIAPIYDPSTGILMINSESLKAQDGSPSNIKKMEIYYKTETGEVPFLKLKQEETGVVLDGVDAFGSIDTTRLYDFKGDAIRLNHLYPTAQNNDVLYYNAQAVNDLKKFDKVIFNYMSIFVAIVIVITYLIFFNKMVVNLIKTKIEARKNKKLGATTITPNSAVDIQRSDVIDSQPKD
ncbi:MAG: hypothetical protein LBV55_00065 [Acholeplasmatales bacterium]|nr:hypothetical protein [Acholeplasmatales bacterium]